MTTVAIILLFIFAEGSNGGFWHTLDGYLNFPGFEFWRFFNLAIFVGILVKLLKKPLSDGFKAKREEIRAELIKAENERREALEKLTAIEGKLVQLETERSTILSEANEEAAAEKSRILNEAREEAKRILAQADAEVERRTNQVRKQLRRFAAEESVRRAEERIKSKMTAEKDSMLVKAGIDSIGGRK